MDRTASGRFGRVNWGGGEEIDRAAGLVGWARKREFRVRKWAWT